MSTSDQQPSSDDSNDPAPTTVAIACADTEFRRALADELRTEPDIVVVGEAATGDALLAMGREVVPDVIVLSTDLDAEPISLCDRLAEQLPACRTVLAFAGPGVSPAAVIAGAVGAVPAAELPGEVASVVGRVARGEAFVPAEWASWMLDEYAVFADQPAPAPIPPPALTATEQEVLTRLAHGTAPDAIAAMHEVPTRLVRLHTSFAMAKLHRAARDERERAEGA